MSEEEKKLLLYNALDKIYANNEIYQNFTFFCVKTIYINDTYISIEKENKIEISLRIDKIIITIDIIDIQVRYEDLTNFSLLIEE